MASRLKHKAQAFVVLPTVFVVMACAAGAPAAAPRVSVIVSPRPGTVELGEAWRTTITVRKDGKRYSGASPRVELRARGATYRFPSSRIRRGVFQTKVALKRIGRWRV